MRDLPKGIVLGRRRLIVEFTDPEHLLASLYEFSQAVANDFDLFCRTIESAPQPSAEAA
jgi:hypothetical protein